MSLRSKRHPGIDKRLVNLIEQNPQQDPCVIYPHAHQGEARYLMRLQGTVVGMYYIAYVEAATYRPGTLIMYRPVRLGDL